MVRAVASPPTRRPPADRLAVAVLLLALCLAGVALTPGAAGAGPGTYTNPVSREFADTFADPAVIKAKDGWWYAYGTTDPLSEGEGTRHIIPTARSADLVDWTYVGDAFTEATLPGWAAPDAALWAPDIRYLDGTYYLYYVVTQTTVTAEPNDNAVGVATAPTPTGPWTDSGAPVVGPRRGRQRQPGRLQVDLRPLAVHRPRRHPLPLLRLLLRRDLRHRAERGRRPGRSASRPWSPSTTATRAPTWSATAAGTTCSPPRPTAAPARPPATRCSRAGRPARAGRSPTATASRWSPRGSAAPSWSPPTATPGSAPATTRSSPTWPARTGSSTTPSTVATPSWTSRSASTSGRCCSTAWTGSTAGRRSGPAAGPPKAPQRAPVTDWAVSGSFELAGAAQPASRTSR